MLVFPVFVVKFDLQDSFSWVEHDPVPSGHNETAVCNRFEQSTRSLRTKKPLLASAAYNVQLHGPPDPRLGYVSGWVPMLLAKLLPTLLRALPGAPFHYKPSPVADGLRVASYPS